MGPVNYIIIWLAINLEVRCESSDSEVQSKDNVVVRTYRGRGEIHFVDSTFRSPPIDRHAGGTNPDACTSLPAVYDYNYFNLRCSIDIILISARVPVRKLAQLLAQK